MADSVSSPERPSPARLRDGYFEATERLTLGIVRFRGRSFRVGPVPLVRFGEPVPLDGGAGWSYALLGGALVGEPGGSLAITWREGRLEVTVSGYRPSLPPSVYRWTQYLFHRFQTRLVLLRMRGRTPSEAPPATPAARLAAGALDAGLCLALARGRRRRALAIAAGYHLACWRLSGVTAGGFLLNQRLQAVDGSRLTFGQAALRLVSLPMAALKLRAVHDELAGTEVVRP